MIRFFTKKGNHIFNKHLLNFISNQVNENKDYSNIPIISIQFTKTKKPDNSKC